MGLESLPEVFMGALVLTLIAVVAVVVLWRGTEVARAWILADNEKKYARLAGEAVEFQRKAADDLEKTRHALDDIRQRLVAVEKLLREVG